MKDIKICIFTFLLLGSFGAALFGQSTVITGNFENTSTLSKTVSIDVFNLLDEHSANYLTFVDNKTGDFRINFPQFLTQEILLTSDKKLNLILSPGDSINLEFKKNGDIIFSGANSKTNQEILNYTKIKDWGNFKPECEGKSLIQYKNELAAWVLMEKSNLLKYEMQHRPSRLFMQWAKQDLIYRNANFLIDFAQFKQMNNQILEKGLIDTTIFPIDKDSALISTFYRAHLNQYLTFKYKFQDDIPKQPTAYQNFAALQNKFNLLVKNEKANKSKDLMVIDLFNMLLKIDKENAINFINLNISKIKNPELYNLYKIRLNNLKTTSKPVTFLNDERPNSKIIKDIFIDITERFKGKVIYLDFWATWCGPCRREFPFSHSL